MSIINDLKCVVEAVANTTKETGSYKAIIHVCAKGKERCPQLIKELGIELKCISKRIRNTGTAAYSEFRKEVK